MWYGSHIGFKENIKKNYISEIAVEIDVELCNFDRLPLLHVTQLVSHRFVKWFLEKKVFLFSVFILTWRSNHMTNGIENLDSGKEWVEDYMCEI